MNENFLYPVAVRGCLSSFSARELGLVKKNEHERGEVVSAPSLSQVDFYKLLEVFYHD